MDAAAKRQRAAGFVELDRIVTGTSWGVAIAFDAKRRTGEKWARIQRREQRRTGTMPPASAAGLERQVAALAASHPEYIVMGDTA